MKSNNTYKNTIFTKPLGKPTVEAVWAGIPLSLELSPDSTDDMPTLIDKANCSKEYSVQDGEIYTVRLGMHSNPNGRGAFTRDSIAACSIPTESAKRQVVVALFAQQEISPAVFMDYTGLNADTPFHLEYLYRSAMLEHNNGAQELVLSDNAVSVEGNMIIISHDELKGEIPDYCTYTYDFITVQVRVVFDKEPVEDSGSD